MIYTPAEDSYLLEKYVKKYSKNKSFLDMGSGSGIQIKSALSAGASYVLASDINQEVINKLKSENFNAIQSDLFKNIKEKFDIIAFNPPYLPKDKQEDKESALATTGGKRGDEIILKFLKQAKNHLNKEGFILLIISSLTPKNKIINLLNDLSMSYKLLETKKIFFESLEIWKIH